MFLGSLKNPEHKIMMKRLIFSDVPNKSFTKSGRLLNWTWAIQREGFTSGCNQMKSLQSPSFFMPPFWSQWAVIGPTRSKPFSEWPIRCLNQSGWSYVERSEQLVSTSSILIGQSGCRGNDASDQLGQIAAHWRHLAQTWRRSSCEKIYLVGRLTLSQSSFQIQTMVWVIVSMATPLN